MKYRFFLIGVGFAICAGSIQAQETTLNRKEVVSEDYQAHCGHHRCRRGPTGPTGLTGPTGPTGASATTNAVFGNAEATGTSSSSANAQVNIEVSNVTTISANGITAGTSPIIFTVDDPGTYLIGYSLVAVGVNSASTGTTGIVQTRLFITEGMTGTVVGAQNVSGLPLTSTGQGINISTSLIQHLDAGATIQLQGVLNGPPQAIVLFNGTEFYITQIQPDP